MAEEAKFPNWLQFIRLFPWFVAVLMCGIAIGTWRTHQETALQSLSDQVQLLNKRIDLLEHGQIDTSGKVMGLSERVDAMHETLLEGRKR
jgi:hypothetical protein